MISKTENKQSKIGLFIVEGRSDKVTLENSLRNYLRQAREDGIRFDVVSGDLTLEDENQRMINPPEIRSKVGNRVRKFLKQNKLRPSDLFLVGQICDLDACYASSESFVLDAAKSKVFYDVQKKNVLCSNPESFYNKRRAKKDNLDNLHLCPFLNINNVKIPYRLFYFGINLEHCLYNTPNATKDDKEDFSNTFDEKFAKDSARFEERIIDLPSLSDDYLRSWETNQLSSKAFDPITNVAILLRWAKSVGRENKEQSSGE